MLGVLQIDGEKAVAARRDAFQETLLFGNDDLGFAGTVEVEFQQAAVRRAVVGGVAAVDDFIVGLEAGQQGAELFFIRAAAEDFGARGALRSDHEDPLAVVAGPGREVAQRMGRVVVDELVGRLRRTEGVVVDFLELVLRRIDPCFRGVVGAVIESLGVGRPCGARELYPFDAVAGRLARCNVEHPNLHPVRSRCGHSIGAIFAVLGERDSREGHRAVVGQGVGVEEDAAIAVGRIGAVEHRLVLKSVVVKPVPGVAVFGGDALLGVVPQFGKPLADGLAERNLRQVVVRHGVLGLDPGCRGFRGVVLQPAVGVGHGGAEIVVDRLPALGVGVGQVLDRFHLCATGCEHRGTARQERGRTYNRGHGQGICVI